MQKVTQTIRPVCLLICERCLFMHFYKPPSIFLLYKLLRRPINIANKREYCSGKSVPPRFFRSYGPESEKATRSESSRQTCRDRGLTHTLFTASSAHLGNTTSRRTGPFSLDHTADHIDREYFDTSFHELAMAFCSSGYRNKSAHSLCPPPQDFSKCTEQQHSP